MLKDHEFNTVNKIAELNDKIIEGTITDLELMNTIILKRTWNI